MNPLKIFILLLTLLSTLTAEEILLKDGTKINGMLIGIKDDTFQVKTAYGEINVPRAQVVSINFPENQPKSTSGESTPSPVDESLVENVYGNRTGGFKVTVPSGWKIAPQLRSTKDIVAALDSQDETLFFLVTPENFAGTMATYKVLAEAQYKSKFADYQKFTETASSVDGKPGLRLTFHGTPSGNSTPLKFMVYIVPYEGRMVRLTFFTLDPLFEDGAPVFEKIAASYRSTAK